VLERLSQWYAGWSMFLDNPILGVGIGNYNAAYDDYRLDQWPVALGHAHNHYLTIAAEAGFLGFLVYVLFWVVVFRACARAIRGAPGRLERAVAVGILSCFAAFATHNLFDVLFVHGMGVTLGLLLTLLHGAPHGLADGSHRVLD
jgi:O-antigen ligase